MPGLSLKVRATIAWALLAALMIAASACGYFKDVEYGIYRGVLTLPGGQAPFGLEIREESGAPVAYLINGPERVRVSDVKLRGRRIEMTMPGFGNRLQATRTPNGLKGHVVLVKRDGVEQKIPLIAERGATHRFFKDHASDNADVTGRWAATFTEASTSSPFAVPGTKTIAPLESLPTPAPPAASPSMRSSSTDPRGAPPRARARLGRCFGRRRGGADIAPTMANRRARRIPLAARSAERRPGGAPLPR